MKKLCVDLCIRKDSLKAYLVFLDLITGAGHTKENHTGNSCAGILWEMTREKHVGELYKENTGKDIL